MIANDTYESREVEANLAFQEAHFRSIVEGDGGKKLPKQPILSLSDLL